MWVQVRCCGVMDDTLWCELSRSTVAKDRNKSLQQAQGVRLCQQAPKQKK